MQEMNYLDRNEFNFEPSQQVVDAVKNFDMGKLCFYTRIYDQGKKSIFSDYLSQLYDIAESQIVLGYGAEDLLKKTVHYFLTLGGSRTMLIPQYSWWYYKSIADEVGGTTLQYPVHEQGNTFAYDFEGLRRMIDEEQPKIVLVASPNNPTGNALTPGQMEQLVEMVPQSTIILVDEAYASFVSNDASYIKTLIEKHANIVVCRTLSKFYGLPGLRMGFGFVGQGADMERFTRYANMYLGYDRLSEEVAIAALQSDDHYRQIAAVMQEARDMYAAELGALPGFKVYESLANFVLVRYPIALKARLAEAFASQSYKVKFMDEPGIDCHMRITLGRREQNRTVCDTILRIYSENA